MNTVLAYLQVTISGMPPFKAVPSLQTIILNVVSHVFQKLCCDRSIGKENLKPLIEYFDVLLPPQIQSAVCEKFLHDASKVMLHSFTFTLSCSCEDRSVHLDSIFFFFWN